MWTALGMLQPLGVRVQDVGSGFGDQEAHAG